MWVSTSPCDSSQWSGKQPRQLQENLSSWLLDDQCSHLKKKKKKSVNWESSPISYGCHISPLLLGSCIMALGYTLATSPTFFFFYRRVFSKSSLNFWVLFLLDSHTWPCLIKSVDPFWHYPSASLGFPWLLATAGLKLVILLHGGISMLAPCCLLALTPTEDAACPAISSPMQHFHTPLVCLSNC